MPFPQGAALSSGGDPAAQPPSSGLPGSPHPPEPGARRATTGPDSFGRQFICAAISLRDPPGGGM
jgi:hypothetical protein